MPPLSGCWSSYFRQLSRKQFLAAGLSERTLQRLHEKERAHHKSRVGTVVAVQRLPTLEGFVALGAVVLLRLTSWLRAFAFRLVLWPGMLRRVMPEPWRHARSLRTAGIGHTGSQRPWRPARDSYSVRTQLVSFLYFCSPWYATEIICEPSLMCATDK